MARSTRQNYVEFFRARRVSRTAYPVVPAICRVLPPICRVYSVTYPVLHSVHPVLHSVHPVFIRYVELAKI